MFESRASLNQTIKQAKIKRKGSQLFHFEHHNLSLLIKIKGRTNSEEKVSEYHPEYTPQLIGLCAIGSEIQINDNEKMKIGQYDFVSFK